MSYTHQIWTRNTLSTTDIIEQLYSHIDTDNTLIVIPKYKNKVTMFIEQQDIKGKINVWVNDSKPFVIIANINNTHWTGMLFHYQKITKKPMVTYIEPSSGGLGRDQEENCGFFCEFIKVVRTHPEISPTYLSVIDKQENLDLEIKISTGYGPEGFKQDRNNTMNCGYLVVEAVKSALSQNLDLEEESRSSENHFLEIGQRPELESLELPNTEPLDLPKTYFLEQPLKCVYKDFTPTHRPSFSPTHRPSFWNGKSCRDYSLLRNSETKVCLDDNLALLTLKRTRLELYEKVLDKKKKRKVI